jgi:hypothetical protein
MFHLFHHLTDSDAALGAPAISHDATVDTAISTETASAGATSTEQPATYEELLPYMMLAMASAA